MLDPRSLSPDERVLVLGNPDLAVAADAAARLTEGLLVIMCEDEPLREGRRALRHIDNVMFVPLDASLPWRDGYFHRVVDLSGLLPAAEICRVTAAND